MITELLSAIQIGMEAGKTVEGLYNGEHYNDVDRAYDLYDAIDFDGDYESEILDVIQCLEAVNNDDRLFVKVAAWNLKAHCYANIGQFAKSRQNIARVLNAQTDSLTINKNVIQEFKKKCRELQKEIQRVEHSTKPIVADRANEKKQQTTSQRWARQDRSQLLAVIAACDKRSGDYSEDTIIRSNPKTMRLALQQYGISISTSKIGAVNTYGGLLNVIFGANQHPSTSSIDVAPIHGDSVSKTQTQKQTDDPFVLLIVGVDSIEGKGVVVSGRISDGHIRVGDELFLVSPNGMKRKTKCVGLKVSGQVCSQAKTGEECEILLRSVLSSHIVSGAWLQKGEETVKMIGSYYGAGLQKGEEAIKINNPSVNEKSAGSKEEQGVKHSASYMDAEQDYLEMYKEYAADGEISERDRRMLDKFRVRCGISEERARELEASCNKPQLTEDEQEYLEMYKEYAADGEISERDRKLLNKMRDRMGISERRSKEIESL